MLVPAEAARIRGDFEGGEHPRVDFLEISRALDAEVLSYSDLEGCRSASVRLARKLFGRNAALAVLGLSRRARTYLVTAENVGMPLAFLMRFRRRRPRHVLIGHRMSVAKKAWIIRLLGLRRAMDGVIAYTREQTRFLSERLGFPERELHCIPFHCDDAFFAPTTGAGAQRSGIVSVGKELRDYPTLVEALRGLEVRATIVGGSPWSRRADQLAALELPPNVELRSGLSYGELRDLYASAALAVVPLQDVDSPAGVTSIFEALAVETPVLVSDTCGIADSIAGCEGILTVPPGDATALREALAAALADPEKLREMGRAGRNAVSPERGLDAFVSRVHDIVKEVER